VKWLRLLPLLADFLRRISDPAAWREPSTYASLAAILVAGALAGFVNDLDPYINNITLFLSGLSGIVGLLMQEKGNVIVIVKKDAPSGAPSGAPKAETGEAP
jgi:hypothetical protein